MKINLRGSKIRLVSTKLEDLDKIVQFEKLNNLYVNHYTKETHSELLNNKDCFHLSIRRLNIDKLIGHMILFGGESKHHVLEFRRLTIDEKGEGYGREAVKLMKRLCFEILKYHRLWLDVYSDNERAIHLYESEGFVFEGELRDNYSAENGFRSQKIYSMLEEEYKLEKKYE